MATREIARTRLGEGGASHEGFLRHRRFFWLKAALAVSFIALLGDLDFSNHFLRLGPIPEGYAGARDNYAALKAAGVPMLGYGQFVTAVLNFLILAFIIFRIVKAAGRLAREKEEAAPVPSDELLVLREIRDALKRG